MPLLNLLPLLIALAGLYFLIKLRFFFILHPISFFKRVAVSAARRDRRSALTLALAGTLGVGNIVGVAYGISVGGPGALFWLIASAAFASALKYAESTLGAIYRADGAGMAYVIERTSPHLARLYALLSLALSFFMGAAFQCGCARSAGAELSIPEGAVAAAFAALVLFVALGGRKKIERITAFVIPVSTLIYIIICAGIILLNISRLPSVVCEVLRGAFSIRAGVGGASGYSIILAVREGFARGLLSNEAGTGTSAAAEALSGAPAGEVGIQGAAEVLFDTTLLCTLTGLAVLLSGALAEGGGGFAIVLRATGTLLPSIAPYVLFFLIFSFAYSSAVCWYYYGSESFSFVFGRRRGVYFLLFTLALFIGVHLDEGIVIFFTDLFLFLMALICLPVLVKNSERVVSASLDIGILSARKGKN